MNSLVFEGGGIYGYAYIGALKELQTRIDFNKIKYVCGSSVGALIAVSIALGLKPEQIEDVMSIQDSLYLKNTWYNFEDSLECND